MHVPVWIFDIISLKSRSMNHHTHTLSYIMSTFNSDKCRILEALSSMKWAKNSWRFKLYVMSYSISLSSLIALPKFIKLYVLELLNLH